MDDETRRYLEAMEKRLSDSIAAVHDRIGAVYAALGETRSELVALMNNQYERLINDVGSMRRDFTTTKGFLREDAATRSRQWLDLEERVSKLERSRTAMSDR